MAASGNPAPIDGGVPTRRGDSDETTRRLVEHAAQEFIERGYEAARVSDIARRAGLTSGAVYARWPHKADVLVAALDYIFEQILPDRKLKGSGVDQMQPPDMVALLGASLLAGDQMRDVWIHMFGSARNNEAIRACLQEFLNEENAQLSSLIELGKDTGFCDPDLSTAAVSLLCQAVGIGTHLLISAGLDEHRIPAADEWDALLWTLISSVSPQTEPLP